MANLVPPETVAAIRRLIGEGRSGREVARMLGVQENTVFRYHPKNAAAIEADAKRPKTRGPYRKKAKPKVEKTKSPYFISPGQFDLIRQMIARGATIRQITDAVGCSGSTVSRFRRAQRD